MKGVFTDITAVFFYDIFKNEKVMSVTSNQFLRVG